jgi:hypothetical protein
MNKKKPTIWFIPGLSLKTWYEKYPDIELENGVCPHCRLDSCKPEGIIPYVSGSEAGIYLNCDTFDVPVFHFTDRTFL